MSPYEYQGVGMKNKDYCHDCSSYHKEDSCTKPNEPTQPNEPNEPICCMNTSKACSVNGPCSHYLTKRHYDKVEKVEKVEKSCSYCGQVGAVIGLHNCYSSGNERVVNVPMNVKGTTNDGRHYIVEHVDRNVDISGWLPVDGVGAYLSEVPEPRPYSEDSSLSEYSTLHNLHETPKRQADLSEPLSNQNKQGKTVSTQNNEESGFKCEDYEYCDGECCEKSEPNPPVPPYDTVLWVISASLARIADALENRTHQ